MWLVALWNILLNIMKTIFPTTGKWLEATKWRNTLTQGAALWMNEVQQSSPERA